jgi:HK97 family phage portal protein
MTGIELRSGMHLEQRDPRGATIRQGYTSPTMPQIDEWNADQAFRFGYAMNVVAYRCVQIRARAGASVPFVTGRKMSDAATIVESSRLSRLLGPAPGGPAPKLSARKLLRWTFAQKIVTGRRAWEIETDANGMPVAFWPLAAGQLKAHPSTGGTDWFRLFEYGNGARPVQFKPNEVFYGWEPSGTDFRQAESELQAARFDLSLVTMCDRHSLGFLRNNAVPAAIITTTQFPNDEAKQKFTRQWASEFGGPDNAGRVAINEVGDDGDGPVGDSIDVKVLGLSAKDSRLIEQRKELVREIAIALGTPYSKLDASGRTFDNAEVEDRTWWEDTILPELIDLQDDINMQLAPRLGSEVGWFDLRGVRALQRRVQPVTQSVGAPALLYARIMKINEARADYGLDVLDDGDRFLTDDEVAILQGWGMTGQADAATARDALAALEVRTAALETPTQPPAPLELTTETQATLEPETRVVDPEEVEQRRARIWRAADATVRTLEARWERAWGRLFARQLDSTLSRLTGKRGRQAFTRAASEPIDVEQLFAREFWEADTAEMASGLYEDVAAASVTRLSIAYGIDFDLAARWVQDFIEARANLLAGQVTTTTYEAIQGALNEGVAAGESIDDLAERIRGLFQQTYANRAETVARTEVISAYNGAATLGASQLPADVVAAQEWIATRDGRTREEHASADGQIVRVGEAFDIGGASMAYPGDPSGGAGNVVNCRCTVAFLTPDEYAEMTGAEPLQVPVGAARMAIRLVRTGEEFDEMRFRRAVEAAA